MTLCINILISAVVVLVYTSQDVVTGQRAAMCIIRNGSGVANVSGIVVFTQESREECVRIEVHLSGFNPAVSRLVGFHVHENKSLANQCAGAGAHLNLANSPHGAANDPRQFRHTGDLANLKVNATGSVFAITTERLFTLYNIPSNNIQVPIVGRTCVVHENQDDVGLGGAANSLTTGNSGRRLGCCIIQTVDYSSIDSS